MVVKCEFIQTHLYHLLQLVEQEQLMRFLIEELTGPLKLMEKDLCLNCLTQH